MWLSRVAGFLSLQSDTWSFVVDCETQLLIPAITVAIWTCSFIGHNADSIFLDCSCCVLPKRTGVEDYPSSSRNRGNVFVIVFKNQPLIWPSGRPDLLYVHWFPLFHLRLPTSRFTIERWSSCSGWTCLTLLNKGGPSMRPAMIFQTNAVKLRILFWT